MDLNMSRWPWRTWDLLQQIEAASDGRSPEQRSGVAELRGLGVSGADPRIRAFERRGFVVCEGFGEIVGGDGYGLTRADGSLVERPIWVITAAGRAALHSSVGQKAKRDAGIVIDSP
jgi:hypothetical protein